MPKHFEDAEREGAVLFLDEVALRRFTWKIKFLPLTDEGKEKLFRKYFQPKGRLSNAVKAGLHDICDLTPGDFKTVHQHQLYTAESSSPNDMVKALKIEVFINALVVLSWASLYEPVCV